MILQSEKISVSTKKCQNLKQWLLEEAISVGKVIASVPNVAMQENYFYFLCKPWITPATNEEDKSWWELRRKQFSALGFNGDLTCEGLTQILSEDEHLRKCCPAPWMLARYFSLEFIDKLASAMAYQPPSQDQIDIFYSEFETKTYSNKFAKFSVSHLYNFDSKTYPLIFGDFAIEKYENKFISKILGDTSFNTNLFDSRAGEYFLVTKSDKPENFNYDWLYEEKSKAEEFIQVLQYFKDGVVHIGFTAPYYLPEWVNGIRKNGLFFIGEPKRLAYNNGERLYTIAESEITELRKWFRIYNSPKVVARLSDERNKLRQAIMRAGGNYEASHHHIDLTRKLGDLVIALEALFSPSDQGELNFRISLTAVHLLCCDDNERTNKFKFLRDMYNRRSKLFHGSYNFAEYYEGRFISFEQIETLSSIVRQSILRFIVLFLKGRDKRDEIIEKLNDGALNPEASRLLRLESDPQEYLLEWGKSLIQE